MSHSRSSRLLYFGCALVVAGLLMNDALPTSVISGLEDERYRARRELLFILSSVSIGIGLTLGLLRRPIARMLPQLALLGLASFFCLGVFVAGDIALGYLQLAQASSDDARDAPDAGAKEPELFLDSPYVGWIRAPGSRQRDVTHEFDVVYEIDDAGFRRIPNPGEARRSIFVFGDSYAFGKGVASDESFAGVMKREMLADDVHVFNAALGGQGVIQMYGRFRSYEDRLREGDLVVFAPISGDLRRNFEDFSFAGRVVYHQSPRGGIPHFPIYRNQRLESISTDKAWLRFKSYFFLGSETRKFFEFIHAAIAAPDTTRDAIEMMADARRRCRARGVDFALIFLPRERELRKGRYDEDLSGFTFFSIWDEFPQGESATRIRIGEDSHWNAEGHRIASRAIVGTLVRNGLLEPTDLRRGGDQTPLDSSY